MLFFNAICMVKKLNIKIQLQYYVLHFVFKEVSTEEILNKK